MVTEQEKQLVSALKQSDLSEYDNLSNLLYLAQNIYDRDSENLSYCLKISKFVKEYAQQLVFQKILQTAKLSQRVQGINIMRYSS